MSHQILPTIFKPTRITSETSSFIADIVTNKWNNVKDSSIIVVDRYSHLPILTGVNANIAKSNKIKSLCKKKIYTGWTFSVLLTCADRFQTGKTCVDEDANSAHFIVDINYKTRYNGSFPMRVLISQMMFNPGWLMAFYDLVKKEKNCT